MRPFVAPALGIVFLTAAACSIATEPVEAVIRWCANPNVACLADSAEAIEMSRLVFARTTAWTEKNREDEFCRLRVEPLAGDGQSVELWLDQARSLLATQTGAVDIDADSQTVDINCIKGGQTVYGRACFKTQAIAAGSTALGCSQVHAIYIPDDSKDSNNTNRRGNIRAAVTAKPYDSVCAADAVAGLRVCFDWLGSEAFINNLAGDERFHELALTGKDFTPYDPAAIVGQGIAQARLSVFAPGDALTLRVWQPPNTPYLAPEVWRPADFETTWLLDRADGFVVDASAQWQSASLQLPVVAGADCQLAVQYRINDSAGIESRAGGSSLACANGSNNPVVIDLYALKPGTDTTYDFDFELGSVYAEPLSQAGALLTESIAGDSEYALVVKSYDLSDQSYISGAAKGFSVDIGDSQTLPLSASDLPTNIP